MKPTTAGAAALVLAALGIGAAMAQEGPRGPGPMGPPEMGMGPMGPGPRGLDFAAIDTDGDGTLTRPELQARAVARIAVADTDGDGIIGRAELIAAMPGAPAPLLEVFARDPAEQMADRILALMGATEAGQVTVAELAEGRVNMLLAVMDTDRDAAISRAEADATRDRRAQHDWRHRNGPGGDDRGPKRGRGDGPEAPMAPWTPEASPDRG